MNAPDRAAWLAARKSGIGGSDVAAILGLSPYRTAVDVWLDKTGQSPDQQPSPAMEWGIRLEDMIARYYAEITDQRIQRVNQILRHPKHEFMLANIDRAVTTPGKLVRYVAGALKGATGILEVKTASAFSAGRWGSEDNDAAPVEYVAQCQWYLGVTGAPWCDLAVLIGGQDYRCKRIERDEAVIADMIERVGEWWQRHIVGGMQPDPVSTADAARLYPRDDGEAIEADNPTQDALVRLHSLQLQIEAFTSEADHLKGRIQGFMREATVLTYGGNPVATWKSVSGRQKINWKAVAEDLKSWAIESEIEGGVDAIRECIDANTTTTDSSRRFVIKE